MNKKPLKTFREAVSGRFTERPKTTFSPKIWEREIKKRIAREQENLRFYIERGDKQNRLLSAILKLKWRGLTLLAICFILFSAAAFLILNNNFSFQSKSYEEFVRQLDDAMLLGTSWTAARTGQLIERPNLFLIHMIDDMAEMSEEPRLSRIVEIYREIPGDSLWRRLADKSAEVKPPTRSELDQLEDYQRWTLYGLAPAEVPLTAEEKTSMFSENAHHWGSLTHQLISLYAYWKYQGEDVDALLDRLSERIAFEAIWDIRVTDLYLQRVAFLLSVGRPDLVRARWVERIIAKQDTDGGWSADWHGWGPDILRFERKQQGTNAHTTVQGMWTLYMLKYRYREWIEQNYR